MTITHMFFSGETTHSRGIPGFQWQEYHRLCPSLLQISHVCLHKCCGSKLQRVFWGFFCVMCSSELSLQDPNKTGTLPSFCCGNTGINCLWPNSLKSETTKKEQVEERDGIHMCFMCIWTCFVCTEEEQGHWKDLFLPIFFFKCSQHPMAWNHGRARCGIVLSSSPKALLTILVLDQNFLLPTPQTGDWIASPWNRLQALADPGLLPQN